MPPFQLGNPGGPGRPQVDPRVKELKALNRGEVELLMAELMRGNRDALASIAIDPNASMMRVMIASIISKGIATGDPSILNFILDRTIGRVKEIEPEDDEHKNELYRHKVALGMIPHDKIIELIKVDE